MAVHSSMPQRFIILFPGKTQPEFTGFRTKKFMPHCHQNFYREKTNLFFIILSACVFFYGCKDNAKPPEKQIVATPEEFQQKEPQLLKRFLSYAEKNNGRIDDSLALFLPAVVNRIYEQGQYKAIWGEKQQWLPLADSMYDFIVQAKLYGLFPEDYYSPSLQYIRTRFELDSLQMTDRRDAALWAKADLLLTSAFVRMVKEIKLGRLPNDSVTMRKDSVLTDEFYQQQLAALQESGSLSGIIKNLEPAHKGYHELKAGIPHFLENARYISYTQVPSPKDSGFRAALQKRLFEDGYLQTDSLKADSLQLAEAVKKFQKKAGIHVDGKVGEVTRRMLNTGDEERFVRIAITLDRYKLLPPKMPNRYLWVNLPGYYLKLIENDTVKLYSKIICGKPQTRSPVLNASISELITYPQWTIPQSIIVKEILPVLKKNPGYLAKKGYSLLNNKSEEVDPYSVDWSKYSKGIPYRIIQGSGDANALGVMKFNFSNKYAIYLHDTNQRSLFSYDDRALSHGCIRVQNWEPLAFDIIRHDNPASRAKEDSVRSWLSHKQKRSVPVRNRLPLFIRYFTCEGKNGEIVFYDDIYGEDKLNREKYFPGK